MNYIGGHLSLNLRGEDDVDVEVINNYGWFFIVLVDNLAWKPGRILKRFFGQEEGTTRYKNIVRVEYYIFEDSAELFTAEGESFYVEGVRSIKSERGADYVFYEQETLTLRFDKPIEAMFDGHTLYLYA